MLSNSAGRINFLVGRVIAQISIIRVLSYDVFVIVQAKVVI